MRCSKAGAGSFFNPKGTASMFDLAYLKYRFFPEINVDSFYLEVPKVLHGCLL